MDKEKLLLELNNQAELINAHISRLKISGKNIHVLDVEMLRKKTVELYEIVIELGMLVDGATKIKETETQKVIPLVEKQPLVETMVIEETVNNTDKRKDEEVIAVEETIPESVVLEPVPAPITQSSVILEAEPPAKEDEVIENKEDLLPKVDQQPQTTYDLFSSNSDNVVAEKYHENDEPSIADKMQQSHISNIREAIGINEKFLFINELFNGDLGRYNKILDDINELPTKQGIDTYLFELKIQFQWADDSDAYLKLKELLNRKLFT